MEETSTEVVTHSEPQNVRLRTAVVVAAMLILPAAAVLGVKSPGGASSPKKSEALAAAKPQTPSPAALEPEKAPRTQGLFHQAAAAAVVHAGGSSAPVDGRDSQIQPASANIDVPGQAANSQSGVASAGPYSPPVETSPLGSPNVAGTTSGGTEQFTQIQQRLRALGATHYALETWGTDGQFFRFQCQMAAGHNAAYTRKFEATDSDALRTMQAVLSDVEAWKSGRMP